MLHIDDSMWQQKVTVRLSFLFFKVMLMLTQILQRMWVTFHHWLFVNKSGFGSQKGSIFNFTQFKLPKKKKNVNKLNNAAVWETGTYSFIQHLCFCPLPTFYECRFCMFCVCALTWKNIGVCALSICLYLLWVFVGEGKDSMHVCVSLLSCAPAWHHFFWKLQLLMRADRSLAEWP